MANYKLIWRGAQAVMTVRRGAQEGVRLAGEHLLEESVEQCPIAEGDLRRSARNTPTDDGLGAVVSYDTPYAVKQHEELSYRHPKGGKAKYLEDPLHSEAPKMRRIIRAQIRRAVKSVG